MSCLLCLSIMHPYWTYNKAECLQYMNVWIIILWFNLFSYPKYRKTERYLFRLLVAEQISRLAWMLVLGVCVCARAWDRLYTELAYSCFFACEPRAPPNRIFFLFIYRDLMVHAFSSTYTYMFLGTHYWIFRARPARLVLFILIKCNDLSLSHSNS